MDMLSKTAQYIYAIDTRHTWAQAPVKFEDALGRIFPVPSEYDWEVSIVPHGCLVCKIKSKYLLNLEARGDYLGSIQGWARKSESSFGRI